MKKKTNPLFIKQTRNHFNKATNNCNITHHRLQFSNLEISRFDSIPRMTFDSFTGNKIGDFGELIGMTTISNKKS